MSGLTCYLGTAVVSAHVSTVLYGPVHSSSRNVESEVIGAARKNGHGADALAPTSVYSITMNQGSSNLSDG